MTELQQTLALRSGGGGGEAAQILQGFINSAAIKTLLGEMQDECVNLYAGATKQLVVDFQIVERIKEFVTSMKTRCSR